MQTTTSLLLLYILYLTQQVFRPNIQLIRSTNQAVTIVAVFRRQKTPEAGVWWNNGTGWAPNNDTPYAVRPSKSIAATMTRFIFLCSDNGNWTFRPQDVSPLVIFNCFLLIQLKRKHHRSYVLNYLCHIITHMCMCHAELKS